MRNKYFTCTCDRCCDATELSTHLSSLKCIGDVQRPCDGLLLPIAPTDIETDWRCGKCDAAVSNERIEILLSNVEQEVDEMVLPEVSSRNALATAAELEQLIAKLSQFLHTNHYHLFALKHTLIQRYGRETGHALPLLTDEHLQRKIALSEELLKIVDVIDPYTIRLTLYTGIILYELFTATFEREKRRIRRETTSAFDSDTLTAIREYIERGKDAIRLNADIIQGQRLFESFEKAEQQFEADIQSESAGNGDDCGRMTTFSEIGDID